MDALETLKMLLGIEDNEQNSLLSFLISDCENLVCGYCHTDEVPQKLESLIPVIAADMYRRKGYGTADAPDRITSISQGQRSVSFKSSVGDAEEFLKEYKSRLEPFKCRKGRVPSDIG